MIQDNHCTLIAFIDDWLKTKKKLEVKEATYRRLLISFRPEASLYCNCISCDCC